MTPIIWISVLLVALAFVNNVVGLRQSVIIRKRGVGSAVFARKRPLRTSASTSRPGANTTPMQTSDPQDGPLGESTQNPVPQRRKSMSIDDEIKADIERMNRLQGKTTVITESSSSKVSSQKSLGEKAKDLVSVLLVADFFVIIVFLVWFLAGAVTQKTFPVVLERFQDIFQPVVVPALTVLMVGSIASGVLDKVQNRDG